MNRNPAFVVKADEEFRDWTVALGVSVLLHIGFCIVIAFFSNNFYSKAIPLRYIDVDLAYAPPPKGKPEPQAPSPKKESPVPEKKVEKKQSKPVETKKTSIAPKKKKAPVKTKKKEDPKDVIDKAIKRLEKNLAAAPKTDPIADRIKRLEKETRATESQKQGRDGLSDDMKSDSAYDASLIERYRLNLGVEIHENWAFSENLAAGQKNLLTKVTFEVLPNGDIRNVRITRKSGNDYMDSSATMAILKSSPVRPHPPGLNKPFIEVRFEFTPKGLE